MLDSNLDDTLQNGNGMFGNQLLERDEESTLEGDGALDSSPTVTIVSVQRYRWLSCDSRLLIFTRDSKPQDVEERCDKVGKSDH